MFPKDTRILILDDMPSMRAMVKGLLRGMGFLALTEGENGQIGFDLAVKALADKKPFGLIVSDWNMPVLSGIELLEKIRGHEFYKETPFLLVTAEGEFRQVKKAMDLKVTEYVVKPFTPVTFKTKLELCWKKHISGTAAVAPKSATKAPVKPPDSKPGP